MIMITDWYSFHIGQPPSLAIKCIKIVHVVFDFDLYKCCSEYRQDDVRDGVGCMGGGNLFKQTSFHENNETCAN